MMKIPRSILLGTLCAALVSSAVAQVAGTTTIGVATAQLDEVAFGWSARKQILGHAVFNAAGDKVGTVDDLIIAPDKAVSFAIIGAGGFIGVHRHDVAIPVDQFTRRDDGALLLSGATKAAIKGLPAFEYAKPGTARREPPSDEGTQGH